MTEAQRQELADHFVREDPEWTRDFVARMEAKILERRRKRQQEREEAA